MRSEPKIVSLIWEHKRDPVEGYDVIFNEWSNDTFTVVVEKKDDAFPEGFDRIVDEPLDYAEFPNDDEVESDVKELLKERKNGS